MCNPERQGKVLVTERVVYVLSCGACSACGAPWGTQFWAIILEQRKDMVYKYKHLLRNMYPCIPFFLDKI